jgi:hypothetical protein
MILGVLMASLPDVDQAEVRDDPLPPLACRRLVAILD